MAMMDILNLPSIVEHACTNNAGRHCIVSVIVNKFAETN